MEESTRMPTEPLASRAIASLLLVLSAGSACGTPDSSSSAASPVLAGNPLSQQAGAVESGCRVFALECASCHGAGARGDGIHGQHLNPAPSDLLATATLTKTDGQLFERIWLGGAMPPFNSGMPAFKDLLSTDQVWQTVVYVRALRAGSVASCEPPLSAATASTAAGSQAPAQNPSASSGGMRGIAGAVASAGVGGGAGMVGAGAAMGAAGNGDSTGSATSQASSMTCMEWCGCLKAQCETVPGYPFDTTMTCEQRCAMLTPAELSCWTAECDEAGNDRPALRQHHCEHAWGDHGLEECP